MEKIKKGKSGKSNYSEANILPKILLFRCSTLNTLT